MQTRRMNTRVEGPIGWMEFDNQARRNAVSLDMWESHSRHHRPLRLRPGHPRHRPHRRRRQGLRRGRRHQPIRRAALQRGTDCRLRPHFRCRHPGHQVRPQTDHRRHPRATASAAASASPPPATSAGPPTAPNSASPAGRLGLGYAHPGVKTLLDVVGPAYTKEIILHRQALHRRRSRAHGLRQPRPPRKPSSTPGSPPQLATIAANAPLTLAALKLTVGELLRGHEGDLSRADAAVTACFSSADYKEGRTAFMEKRKPAFQGQ